MTLRIFRNNNKLQRATCCNLNYPCVGSSSATSVMSWLHRLFSGLHFPFGVDVSEPLHLPVSSIDPTRLGGSCRFLVLLRVLVIQVSYKFTVSYDS